jgi:hypothetical protein
MHTLTSDGGITNPPCGAFGAGFVLFNVVGTVPRPWLCV